MGFGMRFKAHFAYMRLVKNRLVNFTKLCYLNCPVEIR